MLSDHEVDKQVSAMQQRQIVKIIVEFRLGGHFLERKLMFIQIEHMKSFIEKEAQEKAEEILAKVSDEMMFMVVMGTTMCPLNMIIIISNSVQIQKNRSIFEWLSYCHECHLACKTDDSNLIVIK